VKSTSLQSFLKREYLLFLTYFISIFLIATTSALLFGLYQKNLQFCESYLARANDLNDIIAREKLIGSESTISFELNKLREQFHLKTIRFVEGALNSKFSGCSATPFGFTATHTVFFGIKSMGELSASKSAAFNDLYFTLGFLIPLLVSAVGALILFFYLNRRFSNLILSPITQISTEASGLADFNAIKNNNLPFTEFIDLVDAINRMGQKIKVSSLMIHQLEAAGKIAEMAKQVAHDIRSPLTALDVVMRTETSMTEEKRILARSAITRINDIANNLLAQNKFKSLNSSEVQNGINSDARSIELIASLLESIMSEKRAQFRSSLNVDIEYRSEVSSYGLFSSIQSADFKRVISNLINNAVESLTNHSGKVQLQLAREGESVVISIGDNGKGIPAHILPKLGQRGISFGKQSTSSGSGLGLSHAKDAIEAMGGKLQIQSIENKGTLIKIFIPKVDSPTWFVESLELRPKNKIIIVDDDSSIHQIWQGRFESAQVQRHDIEVLHFSTPTSLQAWVKNQKSLNDILFLIDYEFLGQSQNGLDIIKELNIGKKSILVTSRYEEPQIIQIVQSLEVRMIPKGMAGIVPMMFLEPVEVFDAILIDDDELVHMTWFASAKEAGKSIKIFFTPNEFYDYSKQISRETNIYIDANLSDGLRGEDVAKKSYERGFQNIFISSGYEKDDFKALTFLKGVIGKNPPWPS
jgi:signal transduction histidine kinase